jgi:hypothetical protein
MSRHRWYRAQWPKQMRELARILQGNPFDAERSEGFVLDRVRDDAVEGRFIERINVQNQTIDPFGEELRFERIEFRQSRFLISAARPGLEVIGSSNSAAILINRLAEASDFNISVSNCMVDVLVWLSIFREISTYSGFIDIMQIGRIDLGRGITARAIVKGKEDVKAAAQILADQRNSVVEKIQYRFFGKLKGSVTFSHTGSVIIRMIDGVEVVEFARAALAHMEADGPPLAA